MNIKKYVAWVLLLLVICSLGIAYGEGYLIVTHPTQVIESPTSPVVTSSTPNTSIVASSTSKEVVAPKTITKTVTVHDPIDAKIIADMQANIDALNTTNASLMVQVAGLKEILAKTGTTKATTITPKTRDQLVAIYRVNHPMIDCQDSSLWRKDMYGEPIYDNEYCNRVRDNYAVEVNAWVNQQLATQ